MDHAGRLTVVVLALLALTAGCQSPGGTTATAATATDETPTDVMDRPTNTTANSSSQSLFERHEETIRGAGSVTVERSATSRILSAPNNGSSILLESETTTRVDFDSGRVYQLLQSSLTEPSVSYRNESGATFSLVGGSMVLGPEQGDGIRVNGSLSPFAANESRLQNRGRGTVDGVSGTVYVLNASDGLEQQSYDPENVTALRATYVVDDRGYIAYQRLNLTLERANSTTRITRSVRTTAVGSTTVERPAWVDEYLDSETSERTRDTLGGE